MIKQKRWIEIIVGLCLVACTLSHSVSLTLSLSLTFAAPGSNGRVIYTQCHRCVGSFSNCLSLNAVARETKNKWRRIDAPHTAKQNDSRLTRVVLDLRHSAYAQLSQFFEFIWTPSTKARTKKTKYNRIMWFLAICVALYLSSNNPIEGHCAFRPESIYFEIDISNYVREIVSTPSSTRASVNSGTHRSTV